MLKAIFQLTNPLQLLLNVLIDHCMEISIEIGVIIVIIEQYWFPTSPTIPYAHLWNLFRIISMRDF